MSSRLPPFSTLRAFEAVVRTGSVSRAALELGRTHGAVSKQLGVLHAHAGVLFLEKAGVALRPTAAGRVLAEHVATAFTALSTAFETSVRSARSPPLHIACSASFAMGWLVPHLPKFSALQPNVVIRLSMTSAREMLEEKDADLVVLWDRSAYAPEDQARAIWLGASRFGVVSAPHYPVEGPADGRLGVPCKITHDHTSSAWTKWEDLSGVQVHAATSLSFPHTHLCLGAAAAGMGIAIAEERLAAPDLALGRLTTVTGFTPFADGFAAIPHRSRPQSQAAKTFIDWIGDALSG